MGMEKTTNKLLESANSADLKLAGTWEDQARRSKEAAESADKAFKNYAAKAGLKKDFGKERQ